MSEAFLGRLRTLQLASGWVPVCVEKGGGVLSVYAYRNDCTVCILPHLVEVCPVEMENGAK